MPWPYQPPPPLIIDDCTRNFPPLTTHSASGLGRATAIDLSHHGGNISILDLNEDAGAALVKQLGGEARARFFAVDVTDTEGIAAAVAGTMEWVSQTGKPLGGIIPAAGVGNPGLVCVYETGHSLYLHPRRHWLSNIS